MAKNLYNLTEVSTVNNSDLLHVNQGSVSSDKKVTKQNLLKEVNSSISSINDSLTQCLKIETVDGVNLNNVRENRIMVGSNWINGASTNFSIVFCFQVPNSWYPIQIQLANTWNGTFAFKMRIGIDNTSWGNWSTVQVS